MESIQKNMMAMMAGMINIINQAIESKQSGTPIMSDKDIDIRLADLKEFENETGVMLVNSPNCKLDMNSIISIREINEDNLKECSDAFEMARHFIDKEVVVYLDIVGSNVIVTYTDGYLTSIQSNDVDIEKKIKMLNLPYNIKKDGVYTIKGKISHADKPIFYVNDVVEGGSKNLRNDLNDAKALFDVTPFWFAYNLNPNALQNTIDYVVSDIISDGLDCDGFVFKFNKKQCNNVLNFVGYYWSKSLDN